MNPLERSLRRLAADLDASQVGWALVGGLAISVRAEPRFTRDVDVDVVAEDDDSAESLTRSLTTHGYRIEALVEQDEASRLATVRLRGPEAATSRTVVDLIFASTGIETEIVAAADRLEIVPGLVLPVATIGHLVALKLLARNDHTRPHDAADLVALRPAVDSSQRSAAREAVDLIVARGYARGRDLRLLLEEYLAAPT